MTMSHSGNEARHNPRRTEQRNGRPVHPGVSGWQGLGFVRFLTQGHCFPLLSGTCYTQRLRWKGSEALVTEMEPGILHKKDLLETRAGVIAILLEARLSTPVFWKKQSQ